MELYICQSFLSPVYWKLKVFTINITSELPEICYCYKFREGKQIRVYFLKGGSRNNMRQSLLNAQYQTWTCLSTCQQKYAIPPGLNICRCNRWKIRRCTFSYPMPHISHNIPHPTPTDRPQIWCKFHGMHHMMHQHPCIQIYALCSKLF